MFTSSMLPTVIFGKKRADYIFGPKMCYHAILILI